MTFKSEKMYCKFRNIEYYFFFFVDLMVKSKKI